MIAARRKPRPTAAMRRAIARRAAEKREELTELLRDLEERLEEWMEIPTEGETVEIKIEGSDETSTMRALDLEEHDFYFGDDPDLRRRLRLAIVDLDLCGLELAS